MVNYIGLDAHSKTCTFVVVDENGKERRSQVVSTSEKNLLGFLEQLRGKKILTFEESTLARWLYMVLEPKVDKLVVCNPLYLNRKRGAKNDFNDALHLAQQLRGGFLESVYHANQEFMNLRSVVSAYNDLVGELIRTKCRYSALFRSEAIGTRSELGPSFYRNAELHEKLTNSSIKFAAKMTFDRLQFLQQSRLGFEREFRTLESKYPEIRALTTIPGIGLVRAVCIVAHVCVPERFPDKHHFWSYCGLVVHDRTSDGRSYGKVRRGGIPELKAIFIGAAEMVLLGESPLQNIFERGIQNGLNRKAARRSLARKIATTAWTLMRTKAVFDPSRFAENVVKEEQPKAQLAAQ